MNVVAAYTNEIKKIETLIKNLKERKLSLPLMGKFVDKEVEKLLTRKQILEDDLKKEVELVDAYIENVMRKHNSLRYKI
jgi:hypothetical protein